MFQEWIQLLQEDWHRRSVVWGGAGVWLCLAGNSLRYVPLFFNFLKLSDARDGDLLMERLARSVSGTSQVPQGIHPQLWRAGQGLTVEVLVRSLEPNVIKAMAASGFVSSSALWMDKDPSHFVAVGGLYPLLHRGRMFISTTLQDMAVGAVSVPLANSGIKMERQQVAKMMTQQFCLLPLSGVFLKIDWVIAVIVNGTLGAELLQKAIREALGEHSPTLPLLDSLCAFFGLWGIARQFRREIKHAGQQVHFRRKLQMMTASPDGGQPPAAPETHYEAMVLQLCQATQFSDPFLLL